MQSSILGKDYTEGCSKASRVSSYLRYVFLFTVSVSEMKAAQKAFINDILLVIQYIQLDSVLDLSQVISV